MMRFRDNSSLTGLLVIMAFVIQLLSPLGALSAEVATVAAPSAEQSSPMEKCHSMSQKLSQSIVADSPIQSSETPVSDSCCADDDNCDHHCPMHASAMLIPAQPFTATTMASALRLAASEHLYFNPPSLTPLRPPIC